jgi:hypothetical protein
MGTLLRSPTLSTFLLPDNGMYFSHTEPVVFNGEKLRVPPPGVVLQYSMTSDGFNPGPMPDRIKPSVVLIAALPAGADRIVMFPMFRATVRGETDWTFPPMGLIFDNQTHLKINYRQKIEGQGIRARPLSKSITAQELSEMLESYGDELRVLAYFCQLMQTPNISTDSRPWPPGTGPDDKPLPADTYRILTRKGSTGFSWLPTSGIAAE